MRVIFSGLLLLTSLCSYAGNGLTFAVNSSSPTFVVTLPANPTTGYQWTLTSYDQSLLQMTGSKYVAPQTKLIGAGGNTMFTFMLVKGKTYPQSTQMSFTYARAWDPKSGTVKKVTVNFVKN